jgi:hypothetical protein
MAELKTLSGSFRLDQLFGICRQPSFHFSLLPLRGCGFREMLTET